MIPMTVIHALFEISFQGGAKFSAAGRGGAARPHAYSWIRHWPNHGDNDRWLDRFWMYCDGVC